jgi:hypothetical protein
MHFKPAFQVTFRHSMFNKKFNLIGLKISLNNLQFNVGIIILRRYLYWLWKTFLKKRALDFGKPRINFIAYTAHKGWLDLLYKFISIIFVL